ncbi:MAG: class I tRNA ligase family protein, partial [Deltaproteobacteria bacterium]|nr:class I tRNA ligase family protein [Deltaproteobacteria bacterium]
YIGGIEHAVMHLLYARFFTKALRDIGLLDFDEPFKNLLTQGMVCKETMKCDEHGYLSPEESEEGVCTHCGKKATVGAVEKMSKSKKNTIDPDHIIKRYGADTTRLFSLFAAPPERDLDWNEDGVEGSFRFLSRVWRLLDGCVDELKKVEAYSSGPLSKESSELHSFTHKTIERVTNDVEKRFHFNTAISAIMELTNKLYQFEQKGQEERSVAKEAIEALILMLSPFAPHISEELWQMLGHSEAVFNTPWPVHDPEALKTDTVTLIVQVNGKMRGKVEVASGAGKDAVSDVVLSDEKIKEWVEGKELVKFIYVPDKLANLVVK